MGKYDKTLLKVLPDEKHVASFLQSGEVGQIVGLFLKRNESFVLFYLKDEPAKDETKKAVPVKVPRKE